jgi:antimicrobial peptide system SdpA family protein
LRKNVLGLAVVVLAAGWLALGIYAVHPRLPFNTVRLPLEKQLNVGMWFPQGWNFFTRSPREATYRFFVRDGAGRWSDVSHGPNMGRASLLGIGRRARAQLVESAILTYDLRESAFTSCTGDVAGCLERAESKQRVDNISPEPTLCGTVGVALTDPVPWAWASSSSPNEVHSRVLRLEVRC